MKRLPLLAAIVLATLVGMVGFSHAQFELTVNDGVPASAKMYYLTATGFTGADAITACDSGFHMASISEIQDPGNLKYVTRHTPAYDSANGMTAEEAQKWYRTPALGSSAYDQGSSPPSDHMGWVRTGAVTMKATPDDCGLWLYDSDQHSGTMMSFHTLWDGSYMDPVRSVPTVGWHTLQQTCSLPEPVWCVEDPS
jgi:hypothetical protein